ncbi:hypothetical protein [Dactylosporangium sp. NPDC000521]
MAVLLIGATGNVGPHVVRALGRAPRTVEDHLHYLQELAVSTATAA